MRGFLLFFRSLFPQLAEVKEFFSNFFCWFVLNVFAIFTAVATAVYRYAVAAVFKQTVNTDRLSHCCWFFLSFSIHSCIDMYTHSDTTNFNWTWILNPTKKNEEKAYSQKKTLKSYIMHNVQCTGTHIFEIIVYMKLKSFHRLCT